MDAINRRWQVIRALLLGRPVVVSMLALFYLVAALIAWTSDRPKRGTLILAMAAIPTCGFFALATERLIRYAIAGSQLGIPNHVSGLRRGQIDVMCLIIGVPVVVALFEGASFTSSALLFVPAAAGILVALYARWIFAVWIALVVVQHVAAAHHWAADFTNPILQIALIGASFPVLIGWLGWVVRVAARTQPWGPIADARHERTRAAAGDAAAVDLDRLARYQEALDRLITTAVAGADVRLSSRALSLGLGFDVRPRWTRIGKWVAAGSFVILILNDMGRRQWDGGAYFTLTAFSAVNLFVRLQSVFVSWKARDVEESLLALTPHWPAQGMIKMLFVEIMLQSQIGTWLVWAALSLLLFRLGWIGEDVWAPCILVLFAASAGACSSFMVALSRRRVGALSVTTVSILLCCAAGVVAFNWGSEIAPHARLGGIGLLIAPLAVSSIVFWRRPLQFPVQRVSK